jgi:predicted restriction endonuclease
MRRREFLGLVAGAAAMGAGFCGGTEPSHGAETHRASEQMAAQSLTAGCGSRPIRRDASAFGQDIFRARLMDYWQGRCPLTGISDAALLRASHITPWSECLSDAERLDVHNGFLLSALWDAAFDRGLVTFDEEGNPIFSPELSERARAELRWSSPISLTDEHRRRVARHRERARWQ